MALTEDLDLATRLTAHGDGSRWHPSRVGERRSSQPAPVSAAHALCLGHPAATIELGPGWWRTAPAVGRRWEFVLFVAVPDPAALRASILASLVPPTPCLQLTCRPAVPLLRLGPTCGPGLIRRRRARLPGRRSRPRGASCRDWLLVPGGAVAHALPSTHAFRAGDSAHDPGPMRPADDRRRRPGGDRPVLWRHCWRPAHRRALASRTADRPRRSKSDVLHAAAAGRRVWMPALLRRAGLHYFH